MDPNILRWLEETDSDSENHLNAPELPNEDCSDVEDVPEDHIIDGECQSDSEVEGDESEFQPIENNTVPPMMEESSSDDDVPLSRHRNFFGKNRFRWSAHPPVSRSRTMQHNIIQQPPGLKPDKPTSSSQDFKTSLYKKIGRKPYKASSGTPCMRLWFAKGSSVHYSSNFKNRTNA